MNESTATAAIDELYEFSAPCFFDFMKGESEEETRNAELWFRTALSYAPSPFMARIKAASRTFNVEGLCNFSEEDGIQKASESLGATVSNSNSEYKPLAKLVPNKIANEDKDENIGTACSREIGRAVSEKSHLNVPGDEEKNKSTAQVQTEACTPKPLMNSQKKLVSDKKHQTAKKIASTIRNSSVLKPKPGSAGTPNLALGNQAIKRQKLDGGRSRQILNVKPHNLQHKSKLGLTSGSSNLSFSAAKTFNKLERKVYVREQAAPFVSMAEMMNKFQTCTRDLSLPHSSLSNLPTLKLTRPIEPEFETAQRMRPVRVKSAAELEEEMMAKIPKFKARPLNKKIFEASPLPSLPRSTPKPPEFQEFHLETMARASKNEERSAVASTEVFRLNNQWKPHLTEPKSPALQTSLRAKPPKVKSSIELEQEELENAPKFKARPLNKKIFESKGELGIFCNAKKQVTIPQEFHFATHERIPLPVAIVDLFDKLSLNSESSHDLIPRNTIPNPFHLYTEERGAEKEKKFMMEIIEKQLEEERARVPKANPYPYTTDYPAIPPKPEPKQCTKPEPFQLESLVRHEEEMKREMEERRKNEKEEAQMRVFKAQPVLKEDPIPVPEKVRKPLTQVQEFDLHVNHRAVDRAEFDQKIKEKQMIYKRFREESEAARMIEEEKALKQLRRTMVPLARPLPKFDHPFFPQKSSKETTKPKSPHLRVLERIERKKTNPMDEPTVTAATVIVDELYEFSAPCFFDFVKGESEDEARTAELWFEAALAYAPSPFMARIKAGSRSVNVESLCNFSEEDQMQKASESSDATAPNSNLEDKTQAEFVPDKVKEEVKPSEAMVETEEKNKSAVPVETEASTPKPLMISQKKPASDKEHQTAKKIASMVRNSSVLKPKTNNAGTPNLALENQAIKRQKLDGGRSRQILNVKPHNLPHKSKLGLTNGSSNLSSSTAKTVSKLDRKDNVATIQMPPLQLTRPKEPELETAQRTRSIRVKSSAELEEEMMAKIPKFKARPLNKKIFEAPPLPSIPKSTPKPPEFQEFHLETMARASKNAETSSVASTEASRQNNQRKPHLTEPKTPVLQTSLRARPTKVKSSIELEQEELENAPKFKARPLNKKIFESKGELGIFCNAKKQVTIPQEFHFATHERIPPPPAVFDLFDKLCLNSEFPRKTIPNPFHLHTEERGAEKEKKFVTEVIEKQFEEERARVPKSNPYPYTTDYPVVPPKPKPKQCTKPEPFSLSARCSNNILCRDPIPVPEKARKPLTQVQEFELHVNHRAAERAEFDQKIKEKEMTYKRNREESQAARMIEEAKALKQLRRTMVPHARPLPKFDHPFCPQKSCKETTKPKSPRLRALQRIERKKRIGSFTAPTSSPATLIR
ncbi:hypothetical protein GQ457_13G006360 [Hibiscus cannabinus]